MGNVAHQAICVIIEQSLGSQGGNIDQDIDRSTQKVALRNRGACLFVTSRESSSTLTPENSAQRPTQPWETLACDCASLSTVYDCPVRIWEVNDTGSIPESEISPLENQDGLTGCPIIQGKTLRPGYELYLETGTCNMQSLTESEHY